MINISGGFVSRKSRYVTAPCLSTISPPTLKTALSYPNGYANMQSKTAAAISNNDILIPRDMCHKNTPTNDRDIGKIGYLPLYSVFLCRNVEFYHRAGPSEKIMVQ